MIWLLQLPATIGGLLAVLVTVGFSVLGLALVRRFVSQARLQSANDVSAQLFTLAGVLYAVLVAFVVVVVWQNFDQAQTSTGSEATAISDLLRDSEAFPPDARSQVQQSLVAYTKDVVDVEFPRMRRGEPIEQQSAHLTQIWQSYLRVQPATQSEIAFYKESISRLDDLGSARKLRISTSQSEIPGELWVLLIGGGLVTLVFSYMFGTDDLLVHAGGIALSAALLAFVLYMAYALEHPFVGVISVQSEAYLPVLEEWAHVMPG